jgi:hypothetical protein
MDNPLNVDFEPYDIDVELDEEEYQWYWIVEM